MFISLEVKHILFQYKILIYMILVLKISIIMYLLRGGLRPYWVLSIFMFGKLELFVDFYHYSIRKLRFFKCLYLNLVESL